MIVEPQLDRDATPADVSSATQDDIIRFPSRDCEGAVY
jgi:hypothetical protein